jgi:TolA-binding protein
MRVLSVFVLMVGALISNTASAQSLEERVRELERRVQQLEKQQSERQQPATRRHARQRREPRTVGDI